MDCRCPVNRETKAESDLYEKNARALISIWGPYNENAIQYDYSAKAVEWYGKDFYKARWQKFIEFLNLELQKEEKDRYKEEKINHRFNRPSNTANDFYKAMAKWESDWSERNDEHFSHKPNGDEIKTVSQFYQKWLPTANQLLK